MSCLHYVVQCKRYNLYTIILSRDSIIFFDDGGPLQGRAPWTHQCLSKPQPDRALE